MAKEPISYDGETWKPVDGFHGRYEVSNLGRVRSYDTDKFIEAVLEGRDPPKIIRGLHTASNGYKTVSFIKHGKIKTFHVHVLVCKAFIGPRPDGYHASHKDGDKSNNRLNNLRWASAKQNNADKIAHGTHQRGESHAGSKLTERDVREIRGRIAKGETGYSIAKDYPVSGGLIGRIRAGKAWAWLS